MITCRYCGIYSTISNSFCSYEIIGKQRLVKKFCKIVSKEVSSDTESCEEFTPTGIFYCLKNSHRYDLLVCMTRRTRARDPNYSQYNYLLPCLKCSQGKIVKEVAKLMGIVERSPEKNKKIQLVKRKVLIEESTEKNKKIQLVKRRISL